MAEDGGMMAKTRLSQNPFAIKTATPTRSLADSTEGKETRPVLAPPTLKWGNDVPCGVSSSSPKVFLRPSALAAQAEKLKTNNSEGENNQANNEDGGGCSSAGLDGPDSSLSSSQPSFLPASKDDATVSQSGFVFGQNLHERVVVNFGAAKETSCKEPEQNELTFEAAASLKESVLKENSSEQSPESKPSKSLTESAEEYQSRQVKRKFSEVTVVTGEEEESNVLQMSCKLFSFNKITSSWQERGRGILRLNDKEVEGVLQSRMVMRTHGSLRVVLNTKIWDGMTVEHPSQKSVRISALDSDGIMVFLIMAGGKDAEQLFSALDWRVTMLKSQEERLDAQEEESTQKSLDVSFADSTQATNSSGGGGAGAAASSAASSVASFASHATNQSPPAPKRWRNSDPNHHSGDDADQPESSTASGSISPAEGDLSSDSGFPTAEDS